MTSLPLFHSNFLNEEIYEYIFSYLDLNLEIKKGKSSNVNIALLCILNLTKGGWLQNTFSTSKKFMA